MPLPASVQPEHPRAILEILEWFYPQGSAPPPNAPLTNLCCSLMSEVMACAGEANLDPRPDATRPGGMYQVVQEICQLWYAIRRNLERYEFCRRQVAARNLGRFVLAKNGVVD